mgnify:CR=1 FL=1
MRFLNNNYQKPSKIKLNFLRFIILVYMRIVIFKYLRL